MDVLKIKNTDVNISKEEITVAMYQTKLTDGSAK